MVHLAPEKRQVTIISIYLCLIYMNTTNHSVPLQTIFVFNQLLKCICNCVNENILIILTQIANIFADMTDIVTYFCDCAVMIPVYVYGLGLCLFFFSHNSSCTHQIFIFFTNFLKCDLQCVCVVHTIKVEYLLFMCCINTVKKVLSLKNLFVLFF